MTKTDTNEATPRLLPNRPPAVGELVQIRSRRWLVEEVVAPTTPSQSPLVRLACADDDSQGQVLAIVRDYELDRLILAEEGGRDLAAKGLLRSPIPRARRPRRVLHAKAVVADTQAVFLTSAKLTAAALDRNIELGNLVRDRALAASVLRHFQSLIDQCLLHPLPIGMTPSRAHPAWSQHAEDS